MSAATGFEATDFHRATRDHVLLTIADDGFVAGAEMLLFTFLRQHPDFGGRIVVLADDALGAASRARLSAVAPVEYRAPGADLVSRVRALAEAVPALRVAAPRFGALEAFGFTDAERVVYIDGDAFVAGDVSALFLDPRPLLACPDGNTYAELRGEADAARASNLERYGLPLSQCFNSGVLSIGAPLLDAGLRDALVADVDPATWRDVRRIGWTDQLILNRRFAGQAALLDGRFNYMPILERDIRRAHGLVFSDARIVHMAGRYKPWEPRPPGLLDDAPTLAKFHELWDQLSELLPHARRADDAGSRASQALQAAMRPRTDTETLS